jgi:hypothetical protein
MTSMDINTATAIAIVVAAGSELIALSPLKSNSWIQLLLSAARMAFPKRTR